MRFAWMLVLAACSGARTEVAPRPPREDAGTVRGVTAIDAAMTAESPIDAAPAGPIDAWIVGTSVMQSQSQSELSVYLDVGSAAGVTPQWEAELLDDWDRPVPGTRGRVSRVDARRSVLRTAGNHLPATIRRARLYPPP